MGAAVVGGYLCGILLNQLIGDSFGLEYLFCPVINRNAALGLVHFQVASLESADLYVF